MFCLLHRHSFLLQKMSSQSCYLTENFIIEALKQICKEYHERLFLCESQKWDLEYEVRRRDYEVRSQ